MTIFIYLKNFNLYKSMGYKFLVTHLEDDSSYILEITPIFVIYLRNYLNF